MIEETENQEQSLEELIERVEQDDLPTNEFTIEDTDPMVLLGKINEVIGYLRTLQGTIETSDTKATQALETAITALETANSTIEASATALSRANTALTTANTAISSANNAVETANNASTTANNAESKATEAKQTAEGIAGTANQALTTAQNANTTANSANSTANNANTTAQQALTTAQGKQDALTQGQLDAVNSGITSTKVEEYDEFVQAISHDIENKVDKTTTASQLYGTNIGGGQTTLKYGVSIDTIINPANAANLIVQRDENGRIYSSGPTSDYHLTNRYYVKGLIRDAVKILEVNATIGGLNSMVSVTASIPSGYKFLCWLQPATSGWIGSVYAEYPYNSTTNFWNASTNNGSGGIHCCYLVIKDI